MKKIITIIFLLNCFCTNATEGSNSDSKLNIYLCSRLTEAAKQWNDVICNELNSDFSLFRPQDLVFNNP